MLVTAKDLGFDGIEIRGIENEMYVPGFKPFLDININSTKARLERMKLTIPCLTSACYLSRKQGIDTYLKEGMDYIDLASRLGVPNIRVLGDDSPEPKEDVDFDFVVKNLSTLADYAEGKNVGVLVETNGFFADSGRILELINTVNSPNVGVLWDVHHPFRFMKEPVESTYELLKERIAFVHVKDSIFENGRLIYKMTGYGDVPVEEALTLLKEGGYTGFVSLEWVKRWCLELEDPGVVFSHFANFMRSRFD